MFPKIVVPPNHPILIGFSIINHPFWGVFLYFRKPPNGPPHKRRAIAASLRYQNSNKNGSCGAAIPPQNRPHFGEILLMVQIFPARKPVWGWYFIPLFTEVLYVVKVVQDFHQQRVWLDKAHCKTTLFALVRFWCKYLEHTLRFAGGNLKALGSNHIESYRMRSGTSHH